MRVRDLEIAMVLAREMKAAAARSVDASLRVEQLQEVFGVANLDGTERARIQTALQMAGLEPHPSLLDAEPGTAIRFGLAGEQPAAEPAGEQPAAEPAPEQAAEKPASEERAEFPTVGAFARSTLERARRRFGGDREQAASNGHGAPPATATAQHEQLDEPAIAPHDTATPADFGASAETVEHPLADSLDFDEPAVAGPAAGEEVAEEEPAPPAEPILPDEPAPPDEMLPEEPLAHDEPVVHDEPIAHDEPAPPDEMVLPDDSVAHGGPVPGDEPLAHEEPVAHDEALPDEPFPDHPWPEEPVADESPPPFAVPVDPAKPPRVEDVLAALLPAMAIPVLITAIAGWRFGLPFVALSVVGAGLLIGRRLEGEQRRGLLSTIRASSAARGAIRATLLLSIVSAVAAVLIASLGNKTHSTRSSGAKPAPAPAAKPTPKPKPTAQTPSKPKGAAPAPAPAKPRPHHPKPAPSPNSTQGLVRVPPKAPKATTTPTTGTQSGGGTTTTPGH